MRKLNRKKVLIISLIMAVAAAAVCAGFYLSSPARLFKIGGEGGTSEELAAGRLNIALLGFDGDKHRGKTSSVFRTDTIMIASLDLKGGRVSLASIPRDSYVKIAGTNRHDKINHAYVHGYNAGKGQDRHQSGLDTVIRTIEDFLGGIPVHYYVTVDMDGVAAVVDRVGGVYFDVPHQVRTDYGRGRLLLDKGYQLLDGKKFLNFVRDRSVGGDFGRASRQQEIMVEAFRQIKAKGKLCDIPALYRSLKNNVKTNLNAAQIAQLAVFGMKVKPDQIATRVFTGNSRYAASGGVNISYVVIDEKRRVELIREVFGVQVAERSQAVLPAPIQRPKPSEPVPSGPLPSDPPPVVEEPADWEEPGKGEEPEPDAGGAEPGPEEPGEGEDPGDGGEPGENGGQSGDPGNGDGGSGEQEIEEP